MNFQNSWYVIEHNHHYETISHEALIRLPEGSYAILENYETHHEALEEHKRLVRLAIDDARAKLGG